MPIGLPILRAGALLLPDGASSFASEAASWSPAACRDPGGSRPGGPPRIVSGGLSQASGCLSDTLRRRGRPRLRASAAAGPAARAVCHVLLCRRSAVRGHLRRAPAEACCRRTACLLTSAIWSRAPIVCDRTRGRHCAAVGRAQDHRAPGWPRRGGVGSQSPDSRVDRRLPDRALADG